MIRIFVYCALPWLLGAACNQAGDETCPEEVDASALLQAKLQTSSEQMNVQDGGRRDSQNQSFGSATVPSLVFKNNCDFSIKVSGWNAIVDAGATKTITKKRPYSIMNTRISWHRADASRFAGDKDWADDFIEINFNWAGPGAPWTAYPTYSNYNGFNIPSKYEARSLDGGLACEEAGGSFLCKPDECPTGSGPNGYKCQGSSHCSSPWASWSEKCSLAINKDGSMSEKFKTPPYNYVNYPCAEVSWKKPDHRKNFWDKYNGFERSFGDCLAKGMTFNFVVTTCPGDSQGPAQPEPSPSPAQPPAPSPKSGCTEDGTDPWSTGSEVPCCAGLVKTLKNWDGGRWYYKCTGKA